jgi:hypothetical protein
MIDLEKEAEEYAKDFDLSFWDTVDEIPVVEMAIKDFKAGANSKYVQAKIIEAKIEILREFNSTFGIVNRITHLENQLKQLTHDTLH